MKSLQRLIDVHISACYDISWYSESGWNFIHVNLLFR